MENTELEKLKYPAGRFKAPEAYTTSKRAENIASLKSLPSELRAATQNLTDEQLDIPYREGGWTIRQIVHHLADSHMNSFIRFKLALTEDNPTIKAYDQDAWAAGEDATFSIESSLQILDGLHTRLVTVLQHMTPEDYSRTLFHPEMKKKLPLDFMAALYGWHSRHHLTQIIKMKERQSW